MRDAVAFGEQLGALDIRRQHRLDWGLGPVRRFLREREPDILCLQETKVVDADFPADAFRELGYDHIVLHGQPSYHGVAVVSRVPVTKDDRLDWQANREARHLGVRLPNGVRLENVYIPAGGDLPDRALNPKFGQKLDFLDRMTGWSDALDVPTILVGDFNIAPLPCDVWSHRQLLGTVSHTPVEVETLARLRAAADWVDLGRRFQPPPQPVFTWWSYRNKDWAASNRGRRLDHQWVTPDVAGAARAHHVFTEARDWPKPSDHVPLITEFAF